MVKALNLGRSPAQRIPAVAGMVFLAGAALLAATPAQAGRSCESRKPVPPQVIERGMKLAEGQQVLSLLVAANHQETVLIATENGYGKRTVLADFRHSGRGTQGVIAIAASERNGKVVAARLVQDEDEIMLITTGGVLIRTRVREIRELGRATQGVTLIALDEGEKLAGLEKVVETEDEQDATTDAVPESTDGTAPESPEGQDQA